ncbi:MAG: hypothetical protein HQK51_14490 [Oligoflexia bacterium]|nr:hypothetical protein [Oligoflexia bacterium]
MNRIIIFVFVIIISSSLSIANNENTDNLFKQKNFSLNTDNADLKSVLQMIATTAGLSLQISGDITGNVSTAYDKTTMENAINNLAKENNFNYIIQNGILVVSNNDKNAANAGRTIQSLTNNNSANNNQSNSAAAATTADAPSSAANSTSENMKVFQLKYLMAKEIKDKLAPLLKDNDKIISEELNNSFILYGNKETEKKISMYLDAFDVIPTQILIEAKIIEITKNKSIELGISFGDLGNTGLANVKNPTAIFNNPSTMSPTNLSFGLKWGTIDGRLLQMRLAAAEASGDAKIISRPNVVTLNNLTASIKSGITYHIKTLSTTNVGGSGTGDANATNATTSANVAGGLQAITAGLNLQVLPTAIDNTKIKLKISVTNSEPDGSTSAIDGIPGIIDNSAETTIIINDNETATLAGLIKNDFAQSKTGTPFLSDIPFFGWLFKNQIERNRKTELLIFITPHIINGALKTTTQAQAEAKNVYKE